MSAETIECLSTEQVTALTGATRRQLEYWTRSDYLHPINAGKGSGVPLRWPPDQVIIAAWIVKLLNLGFLLQQAIVLARSPYERRKVAAALLETGGGDAS